MSKGLFDSTDYLARYPEVGAMGMDPYTHFERFGYRLGYTAASKTGSPVTLVPDCKPAASVPTCEYSEWFSQNRCAQTAQLLQRRASLGFDYKPLFSVIVPVYRVAPNLIQELVDSVRAQTYSNWEICFYLAYHDNSALTALLRKLASTDPKIHVIEGENEGISENSNRALVQASGDYIVLIDHDDTITENALYEFAKVLQEYPDATFIYSDKDMIDEAGTTVMNGLFKPSWSPEIMLNANYLTHFNALRRSKVIEVGGWHKDTDGAQDWDLFFRLLRTGGPILHIPKVLYHWRMISTSVAGGGMEAKPWASEAQLRAVHRHLVATGWRNAKPSFHSADLIRISWSPDYRPRVGVVLIGKAPSQAPNFRDQAEFQILGCLDLETSKNVSATINQWVRDAQVDVILILSAKLQIITDNWLTELCGPLENAQIGIVCAKTLGQSSEIIDCGHIYHAKTLRRLFKGQYSESNSYLGNTSWYRNVDAASFYGMAFTKSTFEAAGGFQDVARPDLEFSAKVTAGLGLRAMYNPFAEAWIDEPNAVNLFGDDTYVPQQKQALLTNYFNSNLMLDNDGRILLPSRTKSSSDQPGHDYIGEGHYVASRYDFSTEQVRRLGVKASQGLTHVSSVCWIVPHFEMPFYGGILTILRTAEYLRKKGIKLTFLGNGSPNAEALQAAVALAYPELAQSARFYAVNQDTDIDELGLGHLDVGICTLWTTAYDLLHMSNVGKKMYFVQDFEPLFYPASTTSCLVEATYRFGFKAICNTEPLASLYRTYGGEADHFLPSVDTEVFHARNRHEWQSDEPLIIFNYARPGHPRNCFELICPAFKKLKAKYGEQIQIITAGAHWEPSDFGLQDAVTHLGLLSYEETGALYRLCDIGMVAMATRHPSYLPFELMACGAAVCTNYSPYTDWLLKDGVNCALFETSVSSIVSTVSKLVDNSEFRQRVVKAGFQTVATEHSNWDNTCARIFDIITQS